MFTGIITDIGSVATREARGDTHFRIRTRYDTASIDIGASIACSGVCLTVVQKGADWFAVDVSAETLSRTTLGQWKEGTAINLERSLKVGDELGGHIVSGHVDGVGEVVATRGEGESLRIDFRAPAALAGYIAEKGSITVDGASLTVNGIEGTVFGVNLIPHTQQVTTLGKLKAGDRVNLEIDVLARYVARLQQWSKPA
jgi:riboflavin synthase